MELTARGVYLGSNSGSTRTFLRSLEGQGPLGRIAAQLFRTQKSSSRAKLYRGGIRNGRGDRVSYRHLAYDHKGEHLRNLCSLLAADSQGLRWGWREDRAEKHAPWVLYVELPQGQVSFHSVERFAGPDYLGQWDGTYQSEQRIIELCDAVMGNARPTNDERTAVHMKIGETR